jgi:5-methylcytosine-specific restriction protein A
VRGWEPDDRGTGRRREGEGHSYGPIPHRPDKISKSNPEVVALSTLLNALPLHSDRPDRERFRNANGTYMKLCNFLALDPGYHGKGLERGGRLEQMVWNEFSADRERLADLAAAIRLGHQTGLATVRGLTEEPEEEEFPEGLHRARERGAALVKRAKSLAQKKNTALICTVCGFDFAATYGAPGDGYIECHHTMPLSELATAKATRLEDVVLVCSNCHRMIHRRRPRLTVHELGSLLRSPR